MSASAILSESTGPADRPAEGHFPWDIEAAPSVVESDTWLLSFIDILTLLLALFVLLLAQEYHRNTTTDAAIAKEPIRKLVEAAPTPPAPTLQPLSLIQLPALPQIVMPLDRLQIPQPQNPVGAGLPANKLPARQELADPEPFAGEPAPTIDVAIDEALMIAPSPVDDLLESLRSSELADRIDIQTRSDSVRLDIADSILFAPARTRLTDSGLALLKDLAETLNTLRWSLSVEGHTDNVPIQTARFPSNWELSTARATMVARELIRHGVRPDRIRAIGYADTHPRADNDTPEGRNRNRRVTFVLELPGN